jgi:transposase
VPPKTVTITPEEVGLTDEQWALVRPLLPPAEGRDRQAAQRPSQSTGRHLIGGEDGLSSWRQMPEEYGKWESAYRRHELWVKQDLWKRILGALGEEDLPGPATKEAN